MIKGLSYSIPTIGRISIGEVVDTGDGRFPLKHDYFSITYQEQNQSTGEWVPHPLQAQLLDEKKSENDGKQNNAKLQSIPVRLMFDDPSLNFRENYTAFDTMGRPLCVGDGERARRSADDKTEEVSCCGPSVCPFGQEHACKPYGRLNVQIEGQDDPFGTFIFRTSGINSIRVLRQKLEAMYGAFDKKLAGMPLSLRLRARTSAMSSGSVFFYADLVIREGMTVIEALREAKTRREDLAANGYSQEALEANVKSCLENGRFEEIEGDSLEFEEFLVGNGYQSSEATLEQLTAVSDLPKDAESKPGLGLEGKTTGSVTRMSQKSRKRGASGSLAASRHAPVEGTSMQFDDAGLGALSAAEEQSPSSPVGVRQLASIHGSVVESDGFF